MARWYVKLLEVLSRGTVQLLILSTACFSVATGDVEDAPALDPLHKFKVVEKEDGVYIEAKAENVKNGRRNLSIKCKPKQQDRILIVGGYVIRI